MAMLGLPCLQRLSLVAVSGGYSLLRCMGFSLWQLLLLWTMGSRYVGFSSCGTWAQQLWHAGSVAVAHRLSSCGARAQLLRSMWDLPGRKFLTTAPPGKSPPRNIFEKKCCTRPKSKPQYIPNNQILYVLYLAIFSDIMGSIRNEYHFQKLQLKT